MTKNGRKVCGKPVITMSRIVGYYSPVNSWNKGKAQEFKERKVYSTKLDSSK